jgi:hypothetical protein
LFTVRRILLIGLLAASATGCAVVPYESHVVHEVYDPYPYVYPRTQVYVYQSQSYGHSRRVYDHADRDRSPARKSIRRDDRSDRPREHARDAKPAKRDVARTEPRRESKERSTPRERAEPRREGDRSTRHVRDESRDDDRRERR